MLQPLLKAACGARGKRSCQDAPGLVLAAAVRALNGVRVDGDDNGARDVCAAITAQLASMLAQGTLSADVAGSFQALQAAWEQQPWSAMSSGKAARNSLQAVVKALTAHSHWSVRLFAVDARLPSCTHFVNLRIHTAQEYCCRLNRRPSQSSGR